MPPVLGEARSEVSTGFGVGQIRSTSGGIVANPGIDEDAALRSSALGDLDGDQIPATPGQILLSRVRMRSSIWVPPTCCYTGRQQWRAVPRWFK
jgi:hypothetical protein